jgi:hypothetical protein
MAFNVLLKITVEASLKRRRTCLCTRPHRQKLETVMTDYGRRIVVDLRFELRTSEVFRNPKQDTSRRRPPELGLWNRSDILAASHVGC